MTQAVDWDRVLADQQAWAERQGKWDHELKTVIRPRAERSMYDAKMYRTRFPGHTFVLCRLA